MKAIVKVEFTLPTEMEIDSDQLCIADIRNKLVDEAIRRVRTMIGDSFELHVTFVSVEL